MTDLSSFLSNECSELIFSVSSFDNIGVSSFIEFIYNNNTEDGRKKKAFR